MGNFHGRSRAYVAFQARLTPELKDRLARMSYEGGFSQVAIVNAALEYYLDHVETGAVSLEEDLESFSGSLPGTPRPKKEDPGDVE
ncbi:MAG: hypothetical protein C7B43_18825 [Sulfobacillus benefaciens]|jgi:predicted DNA-binding protein|uniref:CopG family transcriptional regulator n=1 Tax=Sulfobacillus benefaciens TaxID=453960 RepID=A0A2T2WQK4_9FIRM|nr:MAG: hypothetical protein C7B43_18825 [Sulfobacillus benefaciens]